MAEGVTRYKHDMVIFSSSHAHSITQLTKLFANEAVPP